MSRELNWESNKSLRKFSRYFKNIDLHIIIWYGVTESAKPYFQGLQSCGQAIYEFSSWKCPQTTRPGSRYYKKSIPSSIPRAWSHNPRQKVSKVSRGSLALSLQNGFGTDEETLLGDQLLAVFATVWTPRCIEFEPLLAELLQTCRNLNWKSELSRARQNMAKAVISSALRLNKCSLTFWNRTY